MEKSGNVEKSETLKNTKKGNITIIHYRNTRFVKFHDEIIMIFYENRRHLVIFLFYGALTRDSEVPLQNKAIDFEVEVLDILNFERTHLI